MTIKEQAAVMKLNSTKMAVTTLEERNRALEGIREALLAHKEEIFKANKEDMERAGKEGIAAPILKRLKFQEEKLQEVTTGILDLIGLPDPLGKEQMRRELDRDLLLIRESCPIGVIGVIFEGAAGRHGADRFPLYQERKLRHLKGRQRSHEDQ